MSGCLDEFLLNGERLPLDGATDQFDVEHVGPVSSQCGIVTPPPPWSPAGGASQPAWRLAVIIVAAVVGLCLIVLVILIVVFCVRRRRTRHSKGQRPLAAAAHLDALQRFSSPYYETRRLCSRPDCGTDIVGLAPKVYDVEGAYER